MRNVYFASMNSEIGRFSLRTYWKNMLVSVRISSLSSGVQAGNFSGSGVIESRLRISSHWPAKLSANAAAFLSVIMRFTCASSTAGSLQLAGFGEAEQFVVGHRTPQEIAQAGGQFGIGKAVRFLGVERIRIALDAEQEFGRNQHRFERELDALLGRLALTISPWPRTSSATRLPVFVTGRR